MLTKTPPAAYFTLVLILLSLTFIFFLLPSLRLYTAVVLGFSYFAWGVIVHLKAKTLHLPIVLEYFAISLLATIILIFLSLRA